LDDKARKAKTNFGVSLGHQIFTPSDVRAVDVVPNDRPYAAWLYVGLAASVKETSVEQFVELDIGTVGPSALGEQVQNGFHKLIGSGTSAGWKNGLADELTLQVFYQKRHKTVVAPYLDVVPYYGLGLGNVLVAGHAGGMVRLGGPRLPDDFGASRPSASDGNSFISARSFSDEITPSYFLFLGSRGNYVIKNIFLDGNSGSSDHRLNKSAVTFEIELGLGMHFSAGTLVWRWVTKSPEFEERKEYNSFASISFVYVP
jgi:lipid A 3-O-deacylase